LRIPPFPSRVALKLTSPRSNYIAHLDGFSVISGGFLNGNYIQLAYQLADSTSGFAYSFFGTCLILFVMNLIPGLSLRASALEEELGLDDTQLGEFAYDYVELRRDASAVIVGEVKGDRDGAVYSSGGSARFSGEVELMPVSADKMHGVNNRDIEYGVGF
jgi:Amt family ammonium transporter